MDVLDPKEDKYQDPTTKEPGAKESTPTAGGSGSSSTTSGGSSGGNYYYGGSGTPLSSTQLSTAEDKKDGTSGVQSSKSDNLYHPSTKTATAPEKKKSKSKKKLYAGAGGILGALAIILIIFTMLGSLFLQSFATTMLDYQFARLNRDFAKNSQQLIGEKATLDTADPTSPGSTLAEDAALNAELGDSATNGLWSKIRGFTPKGTLSNLKASGDVAMKYDKTPLLGKSVLKSITVGDQTIDVTSTDPGLFSKVLHPVQTFNNRVQAAIDINNGVTKSLDGKNIFIRGGVEAAIREDAGIPMYAWIASKFSNKTPTEADVELTTEAEAKIAPPSDPAIPVESYQVQQAVDAGKNETAKALADPAAVETSQTDFNIPGAFSGVDDVMNSKLNGLTSGVLSKASLLYAIAVPLCIIYDGSLSSPAAGKTIDSQDKQLERSFYFVQSASDQSKAGATNAEAVGAMSRKLGNISDSNVEIRANGGTVDSLSQIQSPQASATGQYSIANTFLPSWAANTTNAILSSPLGCPTLTNPLTGVGFLVGQLAVEIITSIPDGGAAGAGETAATAGAEAAATTAIEDGISTGVLAAVQEKLASNLVTSTLLKASGSFAQRFSKKELAKLGAISLATAGLSVIAKQETMAKMGQSYDGIRQGVDFANQADAGANLNNNEVERQELYGAPLGAEDLAMNNNADQQYLASQNKTRSFTDRYFALSNPSSLASRLVVTVGSTVNHGFLPAISKLFGTLTSPSKLLSVFSSLFVHKASAASTTNISDYGIVQWGYTPYESSLDNPTTGNPSYQPLENSKILYASGEDQYIEDVYGACYTNSMGTLLTTNPPGTVDGIATPDSTETYIVRDVNGNVVGGLCSQKYMGPNSADGKAYDQESSKNGGATYDLVFRWRLNHGYNNTLKQLVDVQNAAH